MWEARARRLVTLAGHAGDEETARAGLTDEATTVRAASLGALARMDRLATTDLVAALADPARDVRRRAVIALAPFQGPAVDAALERARQDRDWQVRQAAEDLTDEPTER